MVGSFLTFKSEVWVHSRVMPHFLRGLGTLIAVAGCVATLNAADISFPKAEVLTNKELRLQVTVPTATLARVETSTDLVNWNGFFTIGAGLTTQTDVFAPFAPLRYYRAQQVPAGTLTGDHIQTDAGDLVIHPVRHASFVMTWNGKTIYNDPASPASFTGLPKGDLILVSHSHSDHFDAGQIGLVRATAGVIVAPQAVYNSMTTAMKAVTTVLINGASTNLMGIQIEAVPAYNSYHSPQGSCNGYVVTIGGKRLYMSGDTGAIPETRALQNIDVAFLCVNVPYTMTVAEASDVIRAFRPAIVYPYHFQNQDSTYSNLGSLKTLVGSQYPIEVRLRKWY